MATALETGTNDLLGRIEDRVAVLTFNRPDRRNALSSEMYDGFNTALQAIKTDDAIRVVMVTGVANAMSRWPCTTSRSLLLRHCRAPQPGLACPSPSPRTCGLPPRRHSWSPPLPMSVHPAISVAAGS